MANSLTRVTVRNESGGPGPLLSSAVQPLGQEVELGGLQSLELTITSGSGSDATALQLIVGQSS